MPSLTSGSDSPWYRALRTRKALSVVCKQWREVALPFLFRDIVITRVGQLPAFKRTLDMDPTLFGPMVRSITLLCDVPPIFQGIVFSCFGTILEYCPSMTSLSFGPVFSASADCGTCTQDLVTQHHHFIDKCVTVQKLEYNWSHSIDVSTSGHAPWLPAQLDTYQNLVCLTIFIPPTSWTAMPPRSVEFPALKRISFVAAEGATEHSDLEIFCTWHLPALEDVRFRPFLDPRKMPGNFNTFLSAQHALRVLDIGCRSVDSDPDHPQWPVFDHVRDALLAQPGLRHVVLPAWAGSTFLLATDIAALPLAHVDVWTYMLDSDMHDVLQPGGAPSLAWKSVRLIESGLSTVLDLPHLLPPTGRPLAIDSESCVHDIFGMRIVETAQSLTRQDLPWEYPEGEETIYNSSNIRLVSHYYEARGDTASSSSGSDTEDTESDSTSSSSVDDGWSDEYISDSELMFLQGITDEHSEHVDFEEALEIFSSTLD